MIFFFSIIIYYYNFFFSTFFLYFFFATLVSSYVHHHGCDVTVILITFSLHYLIFNIENLYLVIFYIYFCFFPGQCQAKCCPLISTTQFYNLFWNKWHPLITTSIPIITTPLNAAHVRNMAIIYWKMFWKFITKNANSWIWLTF